MNLNVPLPLHNAFKSATAAEGLDMTTVLLKFIQGYVDEHSPTSKQSKRRSK